MKFKIKTGYYLKRLTPEIVKLLKSTKSKISKNQNRKKVLIWKLLKWY